MDCNEPNGNHHTKFNQSFDKHAHVGLLLVPVLMEQTTCRSYSESSSYPRSPQNYLTGDANTVYQYAVELIDL